MLFNSLEYIVFLPVVFILYWKIFTKSLAIRNLYILIISYVFYGWWDWRFLALIIFSSLIDYKLGILIFKQSKKVRKKIFLSISILVNLGLLGFFKYYNFFIESISGLLNQLDLEINTWSLKVILPVGISFYTFQTLSYSIDIYRGKNSPTRNVIEFLAYVSFFPQLVAGPIERSTTLLPQFGKLHEFSLKKIINGLQLILWGFFKKIVIADNAAVYADSIFNNYEAHTSFDLILGAVFFSFQIYCDFSGYSDIAIGTAKLFGFNLMDNFKSPYFSKNISEFWRKWHISLSTWFKDYLYIPLGGSRGNLNQKVRNVLIIFMISGLWHGANWTFVFWGGLHGLFYMPFIFSNKDSNSSQSNRKNNYYAVLKNIFMIARTYLLVVFAWIFFRSETLKDSYGYITSIYNNFDVSQLITLNVEIEYIFLLFIWIIIDWLIKDSSIIELQSKWNNKFKRYAFNYALIILILLFGAFNQNSFIYFQF